jgi:hypothetical protein
VVVLWIAWPEMKRIPEQMGFIQKKNPRVQYNLPRGFLIYLQQLDRHDQGITCFLQFHSYRTAKWFFSEHLFVCESLRKENSSFFIFS